MAIKCSCGKKATGAYLVSDDRGKAWTVKLCDDCKAKAKYSKMVKIG